MKVDILWVEGRMRVPSRFLRLRGCSIHGREESHHGEESRSFELFSVQKYYLVTAADFQFFSDHS